MSWPLKDRRAGRCKYEPIGPLHVGTIYRELTHLVRRQVTERGVRLEVEAVGMLQCNVVDPAPGDNVKRLTVSHGPEPPREPVPLLGEFPNEVCRGTEVVRHFVAK